MDPENTLFPFKIGEEQEDRYLQDIKWHEVAAALRNREFERIGAFGFDLIADKIDPAIKARKGRPKRSLDFLSKVYWTFEHLRRTGMSREDALLKTASLQKNPAVSEETVDEIVTEYSKLLGTYNAQQSRIQEAIDQFEQQRRSMLFGSTSPAPYSKTK